MRTALAAILSCCIACVGCQREPETATPADELTISQLEELLRQKKKNTAKAQPAVKVAEPPSAVKVAEPPSPEPKPGTYSLKPPPKNLPSPKVSSDGKTFDWGSAMQGEVVVHDFEIRNPDSSPLIIEDVKPACGCTKGEFTKTIAPGATGKITLRVDTLQFSGRIKKTAKVLTIANKVSGEMTLAMEGEVDVVIVQEPPTGKRGITAVPGVPIKPVTLTLKKGVAETFKLNKVSCANRQGLRGSPPLLAEIKVLEIDPESHYELVVQPQIPDELAGTKGTFFYTANIVANVTARGKTWDLRVDLPIAVKKRIDVAPQPTVLFTDKQIDELDELYAGPPTKELRIKSLDPNHSFKILGVRTQGEHFRTRLETVTPGKEYKLAVELAKGPKTAGPQKIVEEIFVDTDDDNPILQELTIKATVHRRKRREEKSTKNSPPRKTTGSSR